MPVTRDQLPFQASPPVTAAVRKAAAYHEAGHAVAAWRYGWPVVHVSIIADVHDGISRAGHIAMARPEGGTTDQRMIESAIISLAGPAAQRRATPRSGAWLSGRIDGEEAHRSIRLVARTVRSERSLRRYATEEARSLVISSADLIASVAHSLMRRSILTGSDVATVIRQAEQRRPADLSMPTAPSIQQYSLQRQREERPTTRRDIAEAALTAIVRAMAARAEDPNQSITDQDMQRAIGNFAAMRGCDPSEVECKLDRLIEEQRKAMRWRRVRP